MTHIDHIHRIIVEMFLCDDCPFFGDEILCVCGEWKVVQILDYDNDHDARRMFSAMCHLYRFLRCEVVFQHIPVVVEDDY